MNEISVVSDVLKQHPIVYSLSPRIGATPAMAKDVSGLANMYRITGDDWDSWGDVASHFDVSRDFAAANLIGANGLNGKSWPDLDMLPIGWLTDPASNEGPHRFTNLNPEELRTQVTLWSMAKSPLMYGGDARKLDEQTYNLLTNPTILEINSFSSNNMEACFPYITPAYSGTRSWIATGRNGEVYLALFNLSPDDTYITANIPDIARALPGKNLEGAFCNCTEAWSKSYVGITNVSVSAPLVSHKCVLLVMNCVV
nr:alpha-galactosidase [Quercus suber]